MLAWIKSYKGKPTLVKVHYKTCLGYGHSFIITVLKSPMLQVGKTYVLDGRSTNFNPYPKMVRRKSNHKYGDLPSCTDSVARSYSIA